MIFFKIYIYKYNYPQMTSVIFAAWNMLKPSWMVYCCKTKTSKADDMYVTDWRNIFDSHLMQA